ncbi:MAG: hypothetical protein M9949_01710 [Candidatus Kapabacteria bacterium]|nr:hypothetical protein [Candidatus Kapabacteria bacterium]
MRRFNRTKISMHASLYKEWDNVISKMKLASENAALAWYSSDGVLIEANELMCRLLGSTQQAFEPTRFFVNPDFSQLKNFTPIRINYCLKAYLLLVIFPIPAMS